ncbi:MAG: glycosyltransferase [Lachnospiraceae bacterium]
MRAKKILIGSPVYQKPKILEAFLNSLKALNFPDATLDYIFVDDNVEDESHQLLNNFHRENSVTTILHGTKTKSYVCDEESHHWNDNLMLKVANYKNTIIQYAISHNYDALFFVDSDLILHPDLIIHLEHQQKEIVSEIFWSQWHDDLPLEPNVWLFDEYDLVPKQLGEELSDEESALRQADFIKMLKTPGLYEVGGLGACTLLRRSALLKGVNFAPIKNLTIHGEDRFFCIRAVVLGIELFVDTCFPAYHIYREPDLSGVPDYILQQQDKQSSTYIKKNRITLSMVVRNEEGHYLEPMLKSIAEHIDNAVIIDDASTDGTVAMCQTILAGIPLKIISNSHSMFDNEITLRKKQWEETILMNPDWILNLDADEIPEEAFWKEVQTIIDNPLNERCDFRLYDMWNETQYREDTFWNAHKTSRTFLLRYQPDFQYQWLETPQHCGRFPRNCVVASKATSEYRIQHLGWSSHADRERKYNRYQQLDPDAIYGIKEQYDSILDQDPHLISWQIL